MVVEEKDQIISLAHDIDELALIDNASERIKRMRKRFIEEMAYISIDRAKYYTENWQETENSGLATIVRVAMAMRAVYQKMNMYIDDDDRLAGKWTEYFMGIPVDIERGIWNGVFEVELKKRKMFFALTVRFVIVYSGSILLPGKSSNQKREKRKRVHWIVFY